MAYAYTPGLKVTEKSIVKKERLLPLPGEVLVKQGDFVKADTVVAKSNLPGNVEIVNVANSLSIPAADISEYMKKTEGDLVAENEIIASTKGLFGFFKSQCKAPTTGTIETVSDVTGQVVIREAPIPVELNAYIDGKVVKAIPNEGVIVETQATFIQGIFGVGGEEVGKLQVICDNPEEKLKPEKITSAVEGKIIVGGSLVSSEAIERAVESGVKGIISGGIDDSELRNFLGYELGVAITGSEDLGITLIITEGFGKIAMASRTHNLLKKRSGSKASINGATQIRAGVLRPEIIIPIDQDEETAEISVEEELNLEIGTPIRIIREPYFGKLGKVVRLPIDLQKLETEAEVRVLEVELDDGQRVILPRANIERFKSSVCFKSSNLSVAVVPR